MPSLFIYPLKKDLLSIYYGPWTVADTGYKAVSEADIFPALQA